MTDKEKKIEHTEGGSTTKDALDAGVPMAPGTGPQGPEDAMDPNAGNRGDYSDRLGAGVSYEMRVSGYREDGSPIIERVRQK